MTRVKRLLAVRLETAFNDLKFCLQIGVPVPAGAPFSLRRQPSEADTSGISNVGIDAI